MSFHSNTRTDTGKEFQPHFASREIQGAEFKRADASELTPPLRIDMQDLKLDALFVLYPGLKRYALADRIEVLPATSIGDFTVGGHLVEGQLDT
jgi:hypothetical protein